MGIRAPSPVFNARFLGLLATAVLTLLSIRSEAILEGFGTNVHRTGPLRSIAKLLIQHPNAPGPACTGIFISDRVALTATHCYQNPAFKGSYPKYVDADSGQLSVGHFHFCRPGQFNTNDIACSDLMFVLFPPGTYKGPTFQTNLYAPEKPESGIPATAYGYGTLVEEDLEPSYPDGLRQSRGLVSRRPSTRQVESDASYDFGLRNGDSGGPLIDDRGFLVGIHWGGWSPYYWSQIGLNYLKSKDGFDANMNWLSKLKQFNQHLQLPEDRCVCDKRVYTKGNQPKILSSERWLVSFPRLGPAESVCRAISYRQNLKNQKVETLENCQAE